MNESLRVPPARSERPYFEAWLHRTRRQFAVSGRLSQVAAILSLENGEDSGIWRNRLCDLLDGGAPPSLDFLIHIDLILAKPEETKAVSVYQRFLF